MGGDTRDGDSVDQDTGPEPELEHEPLGPIHCVGSYISGYLICVDRVSDEE
jgi:hypothetical protein